MSVPPADRRACPAGGQAAISPSHAAFVARLAGLVRQGGAVLDAACGTGTYWPALLAAGLQVTGVDASAAMLAQARRQYPQVPSRVLSLPDLATLPDRFDGLLCVDALGTVAAEDWPAVAAGLAAVLKDRAPAYVTAELPAGPPRDQVRRWLSGAGFAVTDEADADHHWHLMLARTTAVRSKSLFSRTERGLTRPDQPEARPSQPPSLQTTGPMFHRAAYNRPYGPSGRLGPLTVRARAPVSATSSPGPAAGSGGGGVAVTTR